MTSVAQNQTVDQFSNAVAESEREYEKMVLHPETVTNLPLSEWPFPNYQSGPLNPRPIHINLYDVNDKYPEYLLCEYDVDEKAYNKIGEHTWIEDALIQIRHHGQKSFPQVEWVVVAINNRAEHRGVSTFEQSFKVGAIFKAGDVRIRHVLPGGQVEGFAFDLGGNLVYQTNYNGMVITNQYDELNRLTNQIPSTGIR
jgi:hypothetical protein